MFDLDSFVAEYIPRSLSNSGLLRPGSDDCAYVRLPDGGGLVISTDFAHARPAYVELGISDSLSILGRLTVTASLSDVFSSGAYPKWLTINLMLPPATARAGLSDFLAGAVEACNEWGVAIVGGDTKGAAQVCAAATAFGYLLPGDSYLARWEAVPGDIVLLSAPLGNFNAAVILLEGTVENHNRRDIIDAMIAPQLRPQAAVELSRAGVRAACTDLSDGLARDSAHIACASNVDIVIDTDKLPIGDLVLEAASKLDVVPEALCFGCGGEWAHLITTDSSHARIAEGAGATRIGTVIEGRGTIWAKRGSRIVELPPLGHSDGTHGTFCDEVVSLVRMAHDQLS